MKDMKTTKYLLSLRETATEAEFRAACEEHGRCPEHPAYEVDYCPSCGTAARI